MKRHRPLSVILALLAAMAPASAGSASDCARHEITLEAARRDYFIPAPAAAGPGQAIRLVIDARRAASKSRIMFLEPLAAGRRNLHLEVRGARADHSFVVAMPLGPGASVIVVDIAGRGRFDLGFFAQGPGVPPAEYRFTRIAPLPPTPLRVDIPAVRH